MPDNSRLSGAGTKQAGSDPFTGAATLAVGALATPARGILLTTAGTGLGVTIIDNSSATLVLNVGVCHPLAIKAITSLGGAAGVVLL